MGSPIANSGRDVRYPIGRYKPPREITAAHRTNWLNDLEELPALLKQSVKGLDDSQLDTPYRPDGWTVRQVVHHLPDSHLNSYSRFRFALTEEAPAIKSYDEAAWAELADAKTAPVEISLALLTALHERWVTLLRSLSETDLDRTLRHPEWGEISLDWMLGLYAWHGRHHVAHITSLRERESWKGLTC
ncbi:MAG: YfiT family bacillithiol transferase [Bryobacteraceae bacterium]